MEKAILIELLPTGLKMTTEKLMGGAFHKKIDEISDIIRFDEDFYENGNISDEKLNECVKIIANYKTLAEAKGATKIYAYASSMFQEVRNSKKFIDDIFKKTNIFFTVLSTDEELRLVYNAMIGTIETSKGVILQVNPHNTYIMNFAKRSLMTTFVLPFGSNSLAHKFGCDENADAPAIAKKMIEFVRAEMQKQKVHWEEFDEVRFVGTGSLFLSVAKLARKMTHYSLDVANNYFLTKQNIDKAFDLLLQQGFNRTKRLANISSERLDNLISGVAIIKAFYEEKPEAEMFNIAAKGVSDALISTKIVRESSCDGTPNDLLEVSLKNIRYYFPVDESNADNVYTLTFELFHQMSIVHKLTRKHVKALKIAAYLYDCGKRINFENHAKHSREIILNADIMNVNHKDLIIAGFACQLQNLENFNLGEWIKYKDIVDEEDLVCARKIGGLIALASALDAGKQNRIKEISCDLLGDIVIIKCKTENDANYEIFEANKLNGVFKKVFNKTFQLM